MPREGEAKLNFMGHANMRSGLVVAATVTKATGTAERKVAEESAPFAGSSLRHSWMDRLRRGFVRGRHART
jgi:hypothetical protein